jgi:hypothetical protein
MACLPIGGIALGAMELVRCARRAGNRIISVIVGIGKGDTHGDH